MSFRHLTKELRICKYEQGYLSFEELLQDCESDWKLDEREHLRMIVDNTED